MALEIFRLVGSIFVDNDAANESLQKTDEKASSVGNNLLAGVGKAAKFGSAVVAGAGAAVGAIVKVAEGTASTCDVIDKMSQKIGISREAYQEWDYICSQSGMDVNKLQAGMKTLTSKMVDASNGSDKACEAFKALGLSVTDSEGNLKSQESMMNETISALQGMDDETQRAAIANQLFGKAGSEMAPLLNSGAGAVDELTKKAHDLGLVLSDDAIDAGVSLTDTMDSLKRSFAAVGSKLGATLMPMVEKFAGYVIDSMPQITAIIEQMAPIITGLFEGLMPPLMDLAEQIFPIIVDLINTLLPIITEIVQAILPVFTDLLTMLLPPIIQIVEALLPPLLQLLQPILDLLSPILELLQPILDLITSLLDPIVQLINSCISPLIDIVTTMILSALGPAQDALGAVAEVLTGVFSDAFSAVGVVIETITGVFSGLITFITGVFTGDWQAAWNGISQIFSSIWEGIKGFFKIPINWIIGGINAFIRGINKIKIPDWVPIVGGKGFSIREIPLLAKGGVLEKGQTGFLEGNGAEAVVPLHDNKKWISAVARDMEGAVGGPASMDVLNDIKSMVQSILNDGLNFYIDKDKLVACTVSDYSKSLAQLELKHGRCGC